MPGPAGAKRSRAAFGLRALSLHRPVPMLLGVLACSGPESEAGAPLDPIDEPPLEFSALPATWNCGAGCYLHPDVDEQRAEQLSAAAIDAESAELTMVYPLADSLHPQNLQEITFQWRRPSPDFDLFKIRLTNQADPGMIYRFFVPCNPGTELLECAFNTPWQNWSELASASAGNSYVIQLAAASTTRQLNAETKPTIEFSPEPVDGGFYYWSTALRGTYRLPFGARRAVPWIEPGSPSNPSECGGCHTVSRDGMVMAFTSTYAAGYLHVVSAAKPETQPIAADGERNSSMLALNSDGSLVATAYANRLTIRDTATGAVVAEAPAEAFDGRSAYFPEFSPDGTEIAVTLSRRPDSFWSVDSGDLAVIPFDGETLGTPRVLLPMDDEYHYYPSWSPDGEWLVFASAPLGRISYDQPRSHLRLVHRTGGEVYDLARATQGRGNTSTWPKFVPFQQADGQLMFITFNSKIDYGFLLKNSELRLLNAQQGQAPLDPEVPLNKERPQLWLAAIDLRKLPSGDPSSAPVWLPFQELDQRNHLGYWTTQLSCEEGLPAGCGPGERCEDGSCRVNLR